MRPGGGDDVSISIRKGDGAYVWIRLQGVAQDPFAFVDAAFPDFRDQGEVFQQDLD
jgi:hypothetical protein